MASDFSRPGIEFERHGPAEDALGLFAVATKDPGGNADFAGGLPDALPVLLAEEPTELGLPGLDAPRHIAQDFRASPGRHGRHQHSTTLCCGKGPGHIDWRRARNGGDQLVGGGIEDEVDTAIRGTGPSAINQHLHARPLPGRI